jgi:hypothetical protein
MLMRSLSLVKGIGLATSLLMASWVGCIPDLKLAPGAASTTSSNSASAGASAQGGSGGTGGTTTTGSGGTAGSGGGTAYCGTANKPKGSYVYGKIFSAPPGGMNAPLAYTAAVAASGCDLLVTGRYNEGLVFPPNAALKTDGSSNIFLAKLAADGTAIWSQGFDAAGGQFSNALAVDAGGNIYLAGYFHSSFSLGGSTLTCNGCNDQSGDAFVAKFDSSGKHAWSAAYGDSFHQSVTSVLATPDDAIVVAGNFRGEIAFGPSCKLTGANNARYFVAKLNKDGGCVWSNAYGPDSSTPAHELTAVGVAPNGDVYIAGDFQGAGLTLGNEAMPLSSKALPGGRDLYVAKIAGKDGKTVWNKAYGAADAEQRGPVAIAVHPTTKEPHVVGTFCGDIEVSMSEKLSGPKMCFGSGPFEIFHLALSPDSGDKTGHYKYGSDKDDRPRSLLFDPSGSMLLVGESTGDLSFGAAADFKAQKPPAFFYYRFVVKDPGPSAPWGMQITDPESTGSGVYGTALDAGGNVLLGGHLHKSLSFGGALLNATTHQNGTPLDVFVTKLARP